MASAAALGEWARPTIKESDFRPSFSLDSLFPKAFDDWMVDDSIPVIVPPPDMQAQLDRIYNQTLARTYVNKQRERIMLSVAYGGDQSDSLTVHMPEVCYVSQGFKLEWMRTSSMNVGAITIPIKQLLTAMGPRVEPITYWILVGDEAIVTNTQRRIVTLRYGLRRRIPEGMLVRVSNIDRNLDIEPSMQLHQRFIAAMVESIPVNHRQWVVGTVDLAKPRAS